MPVAGAGFCTTATWPPAADVPGPSCTCSIAKVLMLTCCFTYPVRDLHANNALSPGKCQHHTATHAHLQVRPVESDFKDFGLERHSYKTDGTECGVLQN